MDIVEQMRQHVASYKYLSPHRENCLELCDEIERLRGALQEIQSLYEPNPARFLGSYEEGRNDAFSYADDIAKAALEGAKT